MSLDVSSRDYGAYFYELSLPERTAAIRYIDELGKHYPDLAAVATASPGNEGAVYVCVPLPEDDKKDIEISEKAASISLQILLDMGVSIVLMPELE